MKVVLDTNIIISALVKAGFIRSLIFTKGFIFDFLTPAYTLTEINKYREVICKKAGIDTKQFYLLLETIFSYIKIISPHFYSTYINEAEKLIEDKTDIPFLALALAFSCPIWSDDKHFKKQNKVKIFTTKEMLSLNKNDF